MALQESILSPAERLNLHLGELGRLQNNAGSLLQFSGILFAICIYFNNALVIPSSKNQYVFAVMLLADGIFAIYSCFLFLRCLTLAVAWDRPRITLNARQQLLSTLSEADVEAILAKTAHRFRYASYCFYIAFLTTFLLLCLAAFASMQANH